MMIKNKTYKFELISAKNKKKKILNEVLVFYILYKIFFFYV